MQRFETFVGSVTELYRLIQRIKNMEMARLGLSGRHVMCLNYLNKHHLFYYLNIYNFLDLLLHILNHFQEIYQYY